MPEGIEFLYNYYMTSTKPKLLISACLTGEKCRYDGQIIYNRQAELLAQNYTLVPVCPEMLGGLPVPRPAAEIESGGGDDVIDGRSRVLTTSGDNVTEYFVRGAFKTLEIAQKNEILGAILKSKSPSCGVTTINVKGQPSRGEGVTAALLRRHKINVEEID